MATKKQHSDWINTTIGRKQFKDLSERIGEVRMYSYRREDKDDPPHVKRAQKVLNDFRRKQSAAHSKLSATVQGPCDRARSAVLFAATPQAALAIVENLEATAKKNGWIK